MSLYIKYLNLGVKLAKELECSPEILDGKTQLPELDQLIDTLGRNLITTGCLLPHVRCQLLLGRTIAQKDDELALRQDLVPLKKEFDDSLKAIIREFTLCLVPLIDSVSCQEPLLGLYRELQVLSVFLLAENFDEVLTRMDHLKADTLADRSLHSLFAQLQRLFERANHLHDLELAWLSDASFKTADIAMSRLKQIQQRSQVSRMQEEFSKELAEIQCLQKQLQLGFDAYDQLFSPVQQPWLTVFHVLRVATDNLTTAILHYAQAVVLGKPVARNVTHQQIIAHVTHQVACSSLPLLSLKSDQDSLIEVLRQFAITVVHFQKSLQSREEKLNQLAKTIPAIHEVNHAEQTSFLALSERMIAEMHPLKWSEHLYSQRLQQALSHFSLSSATAVEQLPTHKRAAMQLMYSLGSDEALTDAPIPTQPSKLSWEIDRESLVAKFNAGDHAYFALVATQIAASETYAGNTEFAAVECHVQLLAKKIHFPYYQKLVNPEMWSFAACIWLVVAMKNRFGRDQQFLKEEVDAMIAAGEAFEAFTSHCIQTDERFVEKIGALARHSHQLLESVEDHLFSLPAIDAFVKTHLKQSQHLSENVITKPPTIQFRHNSKHLSSLIPLSPSILASGNKDGSLQLWNVKEQNCFKQIDGHSSVESLLALSNGTWVSCSKEGNFKIRDAVQGTSLREFHGHQGRVIGVCQYGETHLLSIGEDRTLREWSNDRAEELHQNSLSFVPRSLTTIYSNHIVCGMENGSLVYLKNVSDATPQTIVTSQQSPVTKLLLVSDDRLVCGYEDGTIQIWDPSTWSNIELSSKHKQAITDLNVLYGDYFVSSSSDGMIRVWDGATGELKLSCLIDGAVCALSFADETLFCGLANGNIVGYTLEDLEFVPPKESRRKLLRKKQPQNISTATIPPLLLKQITANQLLCKELKQLLSLCFRGSEETDGSWQYTVEKALTPVSATGSIIEFYRKLVTQVTEAQPQLELAVLEMSSQYRTRTGLLYPKVNITLEELRFARALL